MPEPQPLAPDESWEHFDLYIRVKDTISALPTHFESEINIQGIQATDLFNLNAFLGAAIEEQVVETLNSMRSVWDPNDNYADCSFIRQSQTFPDVLLERPGETIMGIELKGWYLLAKEGEPSFRYRVTPDACADQDLLVVFCWSLSDVISGEPRLHEPFVESAKRASQYVDYYWQEERETSQDTTIERPDSVQPHPNTSAEHIQDQPVKDSGSNYGRLARTGFMDDYTERMLTRELAGIQARHWIEFLKLSRQTDEEAQNSLENFDFS
jgi:hypothetical protein